MSPLKLLAITLFLPLAIVNADEKVWKARVTVEAPDGKKTQSVSAFLPEGDVLVPIDFGRYGLCTLRIDPDKSVPESEKASVYDLVSFRISYPVMLASEGRVYTPSEIYWTLLPVAFGKDIQLLKCAEGTITVRLSGSEDKE